MRSSCHENRNAQLFGECGQPGNVIAMLVSDKNCRKRARIIAQRLHALEGLAARNAGIDQYPGAYAGNNRAVAAAAGSQHGDGYAHDCAPMLAAYAFILWNRE